MDKNKGFNPFEKYDIVVTGLVFGFALTVASVVLTAASATFSYTGYMATWPQVPGVGYIGVVVAAAAWIVFGSLPILGKNAGGFWKALTAIIPTILFGIMLVISDGYGNEQALKSDVTAEQAAYEQKAAAFSTATKTESELVAKRDQLSVNNRIIQEALKDFSNSDKVKEAQAVLLTAGRYEGMIDGKPEVKTQRAVQEYGKWATLELEKIEKSLVDARQIIAIGEPMKPDARKDDVLLYIGYGVSVGGVLLSLLSSLIIQVSIREKPQLIEPEPDFLSDDHFQALQDDVNKTISLVGGRIARSVFSKTAA